MREIIRSQRKKRTRLTVQTLGGYDYALPDVDKNNNSSQLSLRHLILLLISPALFPILLILCIIIYLLPSLHKKILSRFIPYIMSKTAERTANQRSLLLRHLSGRILDVGCGSGAYFPIYAKRPNVTHVVALEPLADLHSAIRREGARYGLGEHERRLTVIGEGIEKYALSLRPGSFDWVILGNVLCEVDDVQATLQSVHKLLKTGGYVYFSEHVAAPRGSLARRIQNVVNPWWEVISGGCNCNRDSLEALEGMEGWEVVSWEMNMRVFMGPFVMGLARKVEEGV